jgi:phosphate transport system substrate-binding protein
MKNQLLKLSFALVAITLTLDSVRAAEALKVDSKLPDYKRVSGVSGNLNSIGSDTLNNLMTLWA